MARRPAWDGTAAQGWYWLRRNRDGAEVIAFAAAPDWRIADRIGRTSTHAATFVARHYELARAILPPSIAPREARRAAR